MRLAGSGINRSWITATAPGSYTLPALRLVEHGRECRRNHRDRACRHRRPGAILQVIIEICVWLARENGRSPITGATTAGFAAGLALMYGTALLV